MESTYKFTPVGKSKMTLFSIPTDTQIAALKKNYNLTMIISILGALDPKATRMQKACEKNGIRWYNIPLSGSSDKLIISSITMLTTKLTEIWNIINSKEEVFLVHCKYGIRRTGLIAYALLRIAGNDKLFALEKIREVRHEINDDVAPKKFEFFEKTILSRLPKPAPVITKM